MPLEGQTLGHYRLLRLLGSGGMGEVYLAEDARIGQQVAIKVIRSEGMTYPESASAKEAERLFGREATAIARLDHPNILPLYAYGEETLGEQSLTYLVMPYRKEGTLATWLKQRGSPEPLSPAQVVPLLHQAADALQHAHEQQVLHQDIKPTNFLVRVRKDQPDRPDLLLADFGIAKFTSTTASASQSIRGTPTYMAPEQWEGHPVAATDQYALAVMVYELLVGRPPFVGNLGQVMRQHALTPPPAPSTLNAHLSPAIDAVLLQALVKQPEGRFSSVSTFAHAFQEAAEHQGTLQATLAISQLEAATGTTRSLTLPGRRRVSVTVPAGVRDGSTLRLEGQGIPYYEGGPVGPLILTMHIAVERPASHSQTGTEPTLTISMPTGPSSTQDTRPPAADSEASPFSFPSPEPDHVTDEPPKALPRRRRRLWPVVVGIIASLLLILSGVAFGIYSRVSYNNRSTPTKTLDAFCNDLQKGDYKGAYSQFSTNLQQQMSETTFASYISPDKVVSCTHGIATETGTSTKTSLRIIHASKGVNDDSVILKKDAASIWKIDDLQVVSSGTVSTPTPTPTSLATMAPPAAFQRSRNTDLNLSYQYPTDWKADPAQKSTSYTVIALHSPSTYNITIYLVHFTATFSAGYNTNNEVNQADTQSLTSQGITVHQAQADKAQQQIGGQTWDELDGSFVDPSTNSAMRLISITGKHTKEYYHVLILLPERFYTTALQEYLTPMLDSIYFIT